MPWKCRIRIIWTMQNPYFGSALPLLVYKYNRRKTVACIMNGRQKQQQSTVVKSNQRVCPGATMKTLNILNPWKVQLSKMSNFSFLFICLLFLFLPLFLYWSSPEAWTASCTFREESTKYLSLWERHCLLMITNAKQGWEWL